MTLPKTLEPKAEHCRANLEEAIAKGWHKIAPCWPLEGSVASNPLMGFEQFPFEEAIHQIDSYYSFANRHPQLREINRVTIKWCQVAFDQGQAVVSMPHRQLGLYRSWRRLARFDHDLKQAKWIHNLPDDPIEIIEQLMRELGIPIEKGAEFFARLLFTLPGWAGYVKYLADWDPSRPSGTLYSLQQEFLAIRLIIAAALWPKAKELLQGGIEQELIIPSIETLAKRESLFRDSLLSQLTSGPCKEQAVEAQFIFCMDPRSEPLRRALEECGSVETFGAAGFFGLPVQKWDPKKNKAVAACPPIVTPTLTAHYQESKSSLLKARLRQMFQDLKYTPTTPLGLAEIAGPALALWLPLRTWAPRLAKKLSALTEAKRTQAPACSPDASLEAKVGAAHQLLQSIGLTNRFAPTVVLCGHGSQSRNNPQHRSLDCGACSGQPGGMNAQLMSTYLNDPQVREQLAKRGIEIPRSTQFVAAQHQTTLGSLQLLCSSPPKELTKLIAKHSLSESSAEQRGSDWAQTRPEWGLSRHAALIIGPRSLTRSIDLQGRVFLHSYDSVQDKSGELLEGILSGPLVVAQWINSHYLFATFSNGMFGSGSKITQNVTGKAGVVQGNGSDWMSGLSYQSIAESDGVLYHEPIRLQVVVCAPKKLVNQILQRNESLRQLCDHGWIHLICIGPGRPDSCEWTAGENSTNIQIEGELEGAEREWALK